MSLDDVIHNEIGGFGPWQQFIAFGAGLAILPSNLFLSTFPTFVPKFRCQVDACDNQPFPDYRASWTQYGMPSSVFKQGVNVSHCVMFQYIGNGTTCTPADFNDQILNECTTCVYDRSVFQYSLVTSFDIGPCSNLDPACTPGNYVSKIALLDLSYWVGVMFGGCVIGRIGDFLGGRKTIILSSILFSLTSVFLGSADTYWGFTILSFTAGLFALSSHTLAFIYLSEVVGQDFVHLTPVIEIFQIAGSCLHGVVAYSSQNWRLIWWYAAFMNALILPIWMILHESPRWLLSRGWYDEFQRVMKVAAKCNGVQLYPGSLEKAKKSKKTVTDCFWLLRNVNKKKKKQSYFFSSPLIWKNLLLMCLVWMSTSSIVFGVVRFSIVLEGDIYANYFMISISSLMGVGICVVCLKRQSRKMTLIFFLVFGSLSLMLGILVRDRNILLALMIVAKISTSVAMFCCYVLTCELFPGSIRNSALGSSSAVGRVGALLSSLLISSKCLSMSTTIGVLVVFGLGSSSILALFLTDSMAYKLFESLEDVQALEAKSTPLALSREHSNEKIRLIDGYKNWDQMDDH
ncbi:hypothetical protein TCAL_05676, partial [Tigriopus californicus]|eukprot:TCALIF_05676-PA protein Name:"Similar to Slc22a21 Solute carrier family 22 member 21 (Mus musculus)" AED:0.11 eAED:0.12 QI:1/0/0/0.8/0/0.2/5/0/572